MAKIIVDNLTLTYPLLGSGVRKKITSPWASGAGSVARDKDSKSRGVQALKNISFELKDGDRLGIVGPNGAGKSTLLRVLAGIYEPSIGDVEVEGEIATLFNIGLGLQAEATGYRNILLSGLISGKTRKEIVSKIPEIEAFSELGEYLKLPVRTYSNGMAMRLKFSAGTMFEPNILLMDEWLGAGDKKFTLKARKRMQEIVSSAGILVLASHRQRLIQNECNKLLWLESGAMKAFGEVDDILPAFLESMDPETHKKTNFLYTPKKRVENQKPVEAALEHAKPQKAKPKAAVPATKGATEADKPKTKKKAASKKKLTAEKPVTKKTPPKNAAPKKKAGGKKKAGNKKQADKKNKPAKTPENSTTAKKQGRKKRASGKKKKLNANDAHALMWTASLDSAENKPLVKKKKGKRKNRRQDKS